MITGIDHVQIAAPQGCERAALDFYGRLLGLAEVPKPPSLLGRGGAWFRLPDGRELHVGVEAPHAPARKAHAALLVDSLVSLEALAGELAGRGHQPRWDEDLPGVTRFYVDDPFGNRLELTLGGA